MLKKSCKYYSLNINDNGTRKKADRYLILLNVIVAMRILVAPQNKYFA
jgi:hypothetical protein